MVGEIERLEIQMVLISADGAESNRRFRKKMSIPKGWIMLSDEDHATADRHGIAISRRHPKARDYRDGFIQPAVFVSRAEKMLYSFIQKPGVLNGFGAMRRPAPGQVLEAVARELGR